MTTRWLDALFSARPELRPARALLTPTWLGALAVLGLNDHLFKGGGALPGALTGKLSDFAGMIVAPALLAALLGLRSRRGLALCTIAVGLVFSLINLSPACADAWSWLMGLVGFPWTITVDPTDLVALPALALGWRALLPAMRAPAAPAPARRPRPLELGAAALGTLLCVATSEAEDGGEFSDEGWLDNGGLETTNGLGTFEPIYADVYLHNSSNAAQMTVRVRELREEVQVDCFNAAADPGIYFTDILFDEGVTWTLPPLTNAPARQIGTHPDRQCYAVLVSSDTLAPTVLFWLGSDIPASDVEGQHLEPNYLSGAVLLASDPDGVVTIAGSESDIVFPTSAPTPDAYLPQSDATRVAWSEVPYGLHQIAALDLGGDGCAAFSLDDGVSLPRFYLCTPLDSLPFDVGQFVAFDDLGDIVVVRREQDPNDPTPVPDIQLAASRGASIPSLTDATIAAKPDFLPHIGPDPLCGTVSQPQEFSVGFGGDIDTLQAGQTRTYDDGVHSLTLYAVHAERRIILDPECAEGPDAVGDDLELVALWTPSAQP